MIKINEEAALKAAGERKIYQELQPAMALFLSNGFRYEGNIYSLSQASVQNVLGKDYLSDKNPTRYGFFTKEMAPDKKDKKKPVSTKKLVNFKNEADFKKFQQKLCTEWERIMVVYHEYYIKVMSASLEELKAMIFDFTKTEDA